MPPVKLSPAQERVLAGAHAGRVWCGRNVTGWCLTDESGVNRRVDPSAYWLVDRSLLKPVRIADANPFDARQYDGAPTKAGLAALFAGKSGACPTCGKTIQFKADGTLRHHQWRPTPSVHVDGRSSVCAGSGKPAAITNTEEN